MRGGGQTGEMNVDVLPIMPGHYQSLTETTVKSIATCNNCHTPASDPSLIQLLAEDPSGLLRLRDHATRFKSVLSAGCVDSDVAAKMFDGKVQQLPEIIVCGFGDHVDDATGYWSGGVCHHVGARTKPFCVSALRVEADRQS